MSNAPTDGFGRFRPGETRMPAPQLAHQDLRRWQNRTGDPNPTGNGPRGSQPTSKRSWLIALVMLAIGLLLLLATGLAFLTYVIVPAKLVRDTIIEQVKAQTGRTLAISGRTSLSIWPDLSVTLHQVALSPPPGMTGRAMLEAGSLRASIGLLPLLMGTTEIRAVELVQPTIDLRIDANGRRSWDFASPLPTRRIRYAAAGSTPPSTATNYDHLDRIAWQRIVIKDGIVRYTDERSGLSEIATGVNAQIGSGRANKPISLIGDALWNGQRTTAQIDLDTLRLLLSGETTKIALSLTNPLAQARFSGTVQLGEKPELKGETTLTATSFAALLLWTGTEFPNAGPLGAFNLAGFIAADRASVSLGGAKLALGATRAEGSVGLRFGSTRPFVSADVHVTELDIDRLTALLAGARTVARASVPPLRPSQPPDRGATPPRSIDDLLRRDQAASPTGSVGRFSPQPTAKAPQVKGYQAREGWSTEPIDPKILAAIDINARVRITGLKVAGLSATQSVARLTLSSGKARVDIDDIRFYGGRGQGILTANPATNGLAVAVNVSAADIAAAPLLSDLAGFSRLSGTGHLTATLTGAGASQAAIMSSLAGKFAISLKNGAVAGWDVAGMVAGLKQGQMPSAKADPAKKTPFGQMTGDFNVAKGIAGTSNLTLTSKALRIAGTGTIDLGQRKVDMLMRPRFVDSSGGKVAGVSLSSIELPFRVRGGWDSPTINLETRKLFDDNQHLRQTFRDIRQRYKGKAPEDVVRDVLGRDGSGLKKALKGLFR
ncbi:MAG: AsmA family protein [Hyphomicrobiaceae bacterium]|nr:AsmA family protein [Hyphomicrobiaceae bacterium]